jgi:hypothetical protein
VTKTVQRVVDASLQVGSVMAMEYGEVVEISMAIVSNLLLFRSTVP